MAVNTWLGATNAYVEEHRDSLKGSYVDVLACTEIAKALDGGVNAALTAEYRRYFAKLEEAVHGAAKPKDSEEDDLLAPRY